MTEIELLREEAARCRRLSCLVIDGRVESTLLTMAAECDSKAEEIETANFRRACRLRSLIAGAEAEAP